MCCRLKHRYFYFVLFLRIIGFAPFHFIFLICATGSSSGERNARDLQQKIQSTDQLLAKIKDEARFWIQVGLLRFKKIIPSHKSCVQRTSKKNRVRSKIL
jgi:hypothetical protein